MTRAARWAGLAVALVAAVALAATAGLSLAANNVVAAEPAPPAATAPVGAPTPARELVAPLRDVGFDQKLGDQVPLDLEFHDEEGRTVRLGDLFAGKPVILSLAYYDCPMICALALQGIASSLKPLSFTPGKEFEVVTVSFDPRETPELARTKKKNYLTLLGRPEAEAGWHFLTGDAESIRRLTQAVGFRYVWDAEQKQFAHPTGIILLTPKGLVARYVFGIEYSTKDLRLGLVEAADGKIGTFADKLLILCYSYDPRTGRYSGLALNLVRIGGALTVIVLVTYIIVMVRRERRRRRGGLGEQGEAI